MSDFTKDELALGERMFDSQPDSPWTAFCELRELFGEMSLERRQELHDVVAKRRGFLLVGVRELLLAQIREHDSPAVDRIPTEQPMLDQPQRALPPLCVGSIQRGFEYEVRLAVSIPIAWATLLKEASKHHYDYKCRDTGKHGTVNGLYNTACDGEYPSTLAVSWSDLDLTTKVAEQLEYHTADHAMIRAIRVWLRETMAAIASQHKTCRELPGTAKEGS